METLALWLLVAQLTPACYQKAHDSWKSCNDVAAKIGASCGAEPQVFQGMSLSLGKPKMEIPKDKDTCIEVLAVKVSGKLKQYKIEDWNKEADANARPLR